MDVNSEVMDDDKGKIFEDHFEDFHSDTVVSIQCTIHTIGVTGDPARICKLDSAAAPIMSDTGANVCIAPDASKLIKVRTINPIPISLALTSDHQQEVAYCSKMGYLPMLQADGQMYEQPFLINPAASDVIMSPEAILQASTSFHSFEQVGYKTDQPGVI